MREVREKERPVAVQDWPTDRYQLPPLAPQRRNRGFPWFLLITLVLAAAAVFVVTMLSPMPEQTIKEELASSPQVISTPVSQPVEERIRTGPDRAATMEVKLQPQVFPQVEAKVAPVLEVAPASIPPPWPKVENYIETGQDEGVKEAIQAFKTVEPAISEDVGQLITELLRNTHYENLQNLPRVLRMAQVAEWLLGQTGIEAEFQLRINAETRAAEQKLAERLRQPTTMPTPRPTATVPPKATPTGRTVLLAIPPELGLGFSPIGLLQEVEFLLKRKGTTQWKVISVAEYQVGPFVTYDVELQEVDSTNTSWITGMSSCSLKINQTVDVHSVIKLIVESIKKRFP